MLKKTSDDAKKRIVFFIDFSSNFREKSTENHAKSVETSFVHKNRRKSTFGTPFFSKKSIFSEFLGSPRVPRAVPGRARNVPKSFIFLMHRQLRQKTSPDGLREPSGRPRRSPQASPGYNFASIFASILHIKSKRKNAKSVKKTSKNIKTLERIVALIRATDELLIDR